MPILYHFSPYHLLEGSFLRPGNFGRLVYFYGARHQLFRRETAYEGFRKQFDEQLPSRLNCLFCLPTRGECALYRRYISGFRDSLLFEVHTDENGFLADHDAIARGIDTTFAPEKMLAYWSGWQKPDIPTATVLREVLLKGGAYVGRQIPIDPNV